MQDWDKDIELRSDAVRDIIGKTPVWLIRWGSLVLLVFLIILIVGAIWFRYPDRVVASIVLSSDQPPVEMVSKNDGYLASLLVEDGSRVEAGQLLGFLESSVAPSLVLELLEELDSIPNWIHLLDTSALIGFVNKERNQPGELKEYLSLLNSAIREFLTFTQYQPNHEKLAALSRELQDSKIHYDRLFEQRVLRQEALKLSRKQQQRQMDLLKGGAISEAELDKAVQESLDRQFQYEESRLALSSMKLEQDRLEQDILDLQLKNYEDSSHIASLIADGVLNLKGALSEWELNYVFRSPVAGTISLTKYWADNQKIMKGDRVLAIIQGDPDHFVGKLEMPVAGSGKVKPGQPVIVKLDRFPYMEYGVVFGQVASISLISDGNFYMVQVSFPQGLKTSYNRNLELSPGLTGIAEVVTEDMSFLVRIMNPLRALISRNYRNP